MWFWDVILKDIDVYVVSYLRVRADVRNSGKSY